MRIPKCLPRMPCISLLISGPINNHIQSHINSRCFPHTKPNIHPILSLSVGFASRKCLQEREFISSTRVPRLQTSTITLPHPLSKSHFPWNAFKMILRQNKDNFGHLSFKINAISSSLSCPRKNAALSDIPDHFRKLTSANRSKFED
jgi:hypothetical protein